MELPHDLDHVQDRLLGQVLGEVVVEGHAVQVGKDLLPGSFGKPIQALLPTRSGLPQDVSEVPVVSHLLAFHRYSPGSIAAVSFCREKKAAIVKHAPSNRD